MRFVVFFAIAWSVLFLMHLMVYLTFEQVFGINLPLSYAGVALLAALYFVASILARRFGNRTVRTLYGIAATWVGVLWLLFVATVVYAAVSLFMTDESPLVFGTLLGAAAAASVYALLNGQRLIVREETIALPGLTTPLRVAHLSDIHVGTIHQEVFLEQVVALTNSTKSDLVLITGDLFDGSTPISEAMLRPLNTLTAPAYFSTGNHEGYEGMDHVRTTISHLRMTLLENAVAEFRGVRIVGVNDRQILPRGTTLDAVLTNLGISEGGAPTILMYHTPVEWDAARAHGVSLMLSGHTHNGQIFPFTLVVRLFYRYVRGLYHKDGAYLHVSSGTGTWGPAMRLGSTNQVTLLNLVPKKETNIG